MLIFGSMLCVAVAAPVAVPKEGPPPARVVQRDDALARAIRAYRERELTLAEIQVASTQVGYTAVVLDPWFGPTAVSQPYTTVSDALVVLQGDRPLSVTATYAALGDTLGRDALLARIAAKRRAGTAGVLLGLGGIVATSVGLAQLDRANSPEEVKAWTEFTAASAGTMAFGFVVGGIPAAKAQRLERDLDASFDLADLQREIEAHNQALAEDLGLSAAEVARIERL